MRYRTCPKGFESEGVQKPVIPLCTVFETAIDSQFLANSCFFSLPPLSGYRPTPYPDRQQKQFIPSFYDGGKALAPHAKHCSSGARLGVRGRAARTRSQNVRVTIVRLGYRTRPVWTGCGPDKGGRLERGNTRGLAQVPARARAPVRPRVRFGNEMAARDHRSPPKRRNLLVRQKLRWKI